ncbi:MAG: hypothetical protein KF830_03045 [Planctomycetes bacterium]|nr:hypothetical protein [Planctomycetota bacterium]
MATIAFGAPGIDRFHLHQRLAVELQQRRHRVAVIETDPVARTFWRHQGFDTSFVDATRNALRSSPADELAARETLRLGLRANTRRTRQWQARCRRRLARLLPGLQSWFELVRPGLLLLHPPRSAEHALLQFAARAAGAAVLWTGDGLLPHTLQIDPEGLDGDAAAARRHAFDHRGGEADPALLEACLAASLAGAMPCALRRQSVQPPPPAARLRDLLPALRRDGLGGLPRALHGWRRALATAPHAAAAIPDLPARPFATVLLQDATDERLRLDAHAPPSPAELVAAAAAATAAIDPGLELVVVAPRRGPAARTLAAAARSRQVHLRPEAAAAAAAATGLVTFTVNHPLACVALLAGSPVLHTGRARYGLPGVGTRASPAAFAAALPAALADDQPTLRQRFLTRLLGGEHVFCSGTEPDHNGILGLAEAIEAALGVPPAGDRPRHRPGPAWPLAVDRPRRRSAPPADGQRPMPPP